MEWCRRIATGAGALLLLCTLAGCDGLDDFDSRSYRATVVNGTASPIFANDASDWDGSRTENHGILIQPGEEADLWHGELDTLRVRDLDGTTIYFERLEARDTAREITSLRPWPKSEPIGSHARYGLGVERWPVACDGRLEWLYFNTVDVTIESRASGPLIATVITDSDRPIDQPEIQGIFVPRHGEAGLSVQVIKRGWFQFFDAQGELIFTDEFSEHDDHVVVPGVSPSKPRPTPSLDYDLLGSNNDLVEDCEGGGSLVGTVWENTVTALFVAGGIAVIWWLSRRRRRRAAH